MADVLTQPKKAYSQGELDELFVRATERGAVLALLHFDSHGPDAASVRASLVDHLTRLSQEKGLLYCKGEVEKTVEGEYIEPDDLRAAAQAASDAGASTMEGVADAATKKAMHSTFAEVKVLSTNFHALHDICFRYLPLGVEILAPKRITLDLEQAQGVLVDAGVAAQDIFNMALSRANDKDKARIEALLKRRADFMKTEVLEKLEGGSAPGGGLQAPGF